MPVWLPVPFKQVCVQLPTSAVNVTLLAVTAEHRSCSDQLVSLARWANSIYRSGARGQNDWTDRRTPFRDIDPVAYYANSVNNIHSGCLVYVKN